MYIDPITIQTFIYAMLIFRDNNPPNVIALDFDKDERFELTPNSVLRATSLFFNQNKINLQKFQKLRIKLELIPMLFQQTSGIVFYS